MINSMLKSPCRWQRRQGLFAVCQSLPSLLLKAAVRASCNSLDRTSTHLWVVVIPEVIVLPDDLPGGQLLGLLRPGRQHFKHGVTGLALGLAQSETEFAVNLSDGQAPKII